MEHNLFKANIIIHFRLSSLEAGYHYFEIYMKKIDLDESYLARVIKKKTETVLRKFQAQAREKQNGSKIIGRNKLSDQITLFAVRSGVPCTISRKKKSQIARQDTAVKTPTERET